MKDAFAESNTSDGFITKLMPKLRENYKNLLPPRQQAKQDERSYLHLMKVLETQFFPMGLFDKPENFIQLKALFDEGRFYYFPIDLNKSEKVQDLCKIMEENDLNPDTVYLSNVREFVDDQNIWEHNVGQLTKSKSDALYVYSAHSNQSSGDPQDRSQPLFQHVRKEGEQLS